MMSKTRFNMEQEIFAVWQIVDDLNLLHEAVLEKDITRDEISNTVMGLEHLYNLKFQRLMSTFEELIKSKKL